MTGAIQPEGRFSSRTTEHMPMTARSSLSRRDVLSAGVSLLAAGSLASRASADGHARSQSAAKGKARNVIFLVVDGMSVGTFTLADMTIQRRTGDRSAWIRLWDEPGVRQGMVSTRAADSLVTDSAAGGSAWGCGRRLNNGAICWSETAEYEPILLSAQKAGKSTGVVSTARVTHATPASFYANVPSRNFENAIAEQMLERRIDLALGGGATFFPDALLAQHADATVVRTAAEMRRAARTAGRLVGLFTPGHMAYELDRQSDNASGLTDEPSLHEMSMLAIERLDENPEGFVLQIEAGRVDHGGHANDMPASLHDQIAFDETITAVREWTEGRDDTLVIITTDHGTGGPELTLYKDEGNNGFDKLLEARRTLTGVIEQATADGTDGAPARLRELIALHCNVLLTDEEFEWGTRPFRGERSDGFIPASNTVGALASVMANHWGVAFVSTNHTAEHVNATAFGPGSEALPTFMENYQLHGLMTAALGLPAS
jgi:alkaline phosphatase